MGNESDNTSTAPRRKMKFAPKIPPRKMPKEPSETKNDVFDKELLRLVKQSDEGFTKRMPKNERKVAPVQVAFGHGGASTFARSFGNPTSRINGNKHQEGVDASAMTLEKEYIEPWDYHRSYYPATLPLRRPYMGNPEILDEEEFGEASGSSALDKTCNNPAEELGLMENREEARMLFFQLPASLPLTKRSNAAVKDEEVDGRRGNVVERGCSLEELPAGFMGKLLVYKSGIIKMKLGDALFDVSPGLDCAFAQDVVAINSEEQHYCILGELNKRAIVTPDVDSLLDSLPDLDLS